MMYEPSGVGVEALPHVPRHGAGRRLSLGVPEAATWPPEAGPPSASGRLQSVAGPPDGEDVARLVGLGLELLAQVPDVYVDGARVAVGGVAPDRAQQLLAVEQPARVDRERVEQLELREG